MTKIYVKVNGMTCNGCKTTISEALLNIKNVKDVIFDKEIAEVTYSNKLSKDEIVKRIVDLDYYTDLTMISENKKKLKRNISLFQFGLILVSIVAISLLLNVIFGFNIFNMIPTINSNTSLIMLFVIGLLTSIHCISMCGAINLLASNSIKKDIKKPILYNLGRLTSYTLIGGIVGQLGSVISINGNVQGIIILFASIVMLLMALNMMGLINFSFNFKLFDKLKVSNSYLIGILNGFVPCGPLQAMQIYALSTGSFIYGALSMFLFCLGTIPLMLGVGLLSNVITKKGRNIMNKISMVLILVLSIAMINRGLLSFGIDVTDVFKPNYDNYLKAEIKDGYQVVEFDLPYSGYVDFIVQEDIPLKIIINVKGGYLTGCNNSLLFKDFNVKKDLKFGENIIEFIPTESGTFTYTCWMNMIKNKMVVVKDLNN